MSNNIYTLIENHSKKSLSYFPTAKQIKEHAWHPPFEFYSEVDNCDEFSRAGSKETHPWWGKKHSKTALKRMSNSKKGNKSKTGRTGKLHPLWGLKGSDAPQSKKVIVNGVLYNSCVEAAEANGIAKSTLSGWIKCGKATKV